jgi:hypothetical protein
VAAPESGLRAKRAEPVRYDADQKLLAFVGTLTLLFGSMFWGLFGARMLAGGLTELGVLSLVGAGAGAFAALMAWGVRSKMERGEPVTRLEVDRLILAGIVFGVLIGFLVFLSLRFKLQDPGLFHAAGRPEDVPPSLR